jgi:hypothetical protein
LIRHFFCFGLPDIVLPAVGDRQFAVVRDAAQDNHIEHLVQQMIEDFF